jgi:hypothetical protein
MAEWDTRYNEKRPWGRDGLAITQDNIEASRARYEAMKAAERNQATPEQMALLRDADAAIQRGLEEEDRG